MNTYTHMTRMKQTPHHMTVTQDTYMNQSLHNFIFSLLMKSSDSLVLSRVQRLLLVNANDLLNIKDVPAALKYTQINTAERVYCAWTNLVNSVTLMTKWLKCIVSQLIIGARRAHSLFNQNLAMCDWAGNGIHIQYSKVY